MLVANFCGCMWGRVRGAEWTTAATTDGDMSHTDMKETCIMYSESSRKGDFYVGFEINVWF